MRINEICEKAGVTRQWLNKCVDRAEVPGIVRKPNGRLAVSVGPEFEAWIRSRSPARARRKRLASRSVASQNVQDYKFLTVKSLAGIIGCTERTVRNKLGQLTGVYWDRGKHVIPASEEVLAWARGIKAAREREFQRAKINTEKGRYRAEHGKASPWEVGNRAQKLGEVFRRITKQTPIAKFGDDVLRMILEETDLVAGPVYREMSRRGLIQ